MFELMMLGFMFFGMMSAIYFSVRLVIYCLTNKRGPRLFTRHSDTEGIF
jgi:hypothetical protein